MADINLGVGGANSAVAGGYDIANSLKFESDNSEELDYTPSSTTNNKVWTYSGWVKRTEVTSSYMHLMGHTTDGSNHTVIRFDPTQNLDIRNTVGGLVYQLDTTAVYRDTSAWYHIVVAFDTTQATAANRTKVYVNGSQVTLTGQYTPQNVVTYFNTSGKQETIGSSSDSLNFMSGYMTEINFIDGQQLAPTDFGEFDDDSGIWKPKAYEGTYGTNGFYLDFESSGSLGADSSGNGNNFTPTNITAADQATDTPTNNFCTMNPYAPYLYRIIAATDFTNGATQVNKTNVNAWCGAIGTMGVKSGKWYYEARVNDNDNLMLGFSTFTGDTGANQSPHTIGTNIVWYGGNVSGSYWFYHIDSGSQVSNASNRGTVWSNGDVLGVALDIDNSRIDFYVNGSLAGASNTNVDISATVNEIDSTGDFLIPFIGMWRSEFKLNFGGYTTHTISSAASDENGYGNFEYAPPSGYYALCTKNLAEFG